MNSELFIIHHSAFIVVLERAVRLELTIPDLQSGALAAWRRAQGRIDIPVCPPRLKEDRQKWLSYIWSGRRDSNSRSEFGRLACFQLHHFRKSLPIFNCQLPIGAVPMKQRGY